MNKICVYGSLRAGLHNHYLIEDSKLLGTFTTEPIFSLYTLGGFPGLKLVGKTGIVMEVYEVDDQTAKRVDQLEGYNINSKNNSFYDKIIIDTPYGEAGVYIYVSPISEDRLVERGDWLAYVNQEEPELY